jgi:hypothetical protein
MADRATDWKGSEVSGTSHGVPTGRIARLKDAVPKVMPWVMLAYMILLTVALIVWLTVGYIGNEYAMPPWDAQSIPNPWRS